MSLPVLFPLVSLDSGIGRHQRLWCSIALCLRFPRCTCMVTDLATNPAEHDGSCLEKDISPLMFVDLTRLAGTLGLSNFLSRVCWRHTLVLHIGLPVQVQIPQASCCITLQLLRLDASVANDRSPCDQLMLTIYPHMPRIPGHCGVRIRGPLSPVATHVLRTRRRITSRGRSQACQNALLAQPACAA